LFFLVVERLEEAIERLGDLAREAARHDARLGEELLEARRDVLEARRVLLLALALVDREDDVLVLTRDLRERHVLLEDLPADLAGGFLGCVLFFFDATQEVDRLVARERRGDAVAREDRGRAALEERVRAGELVDRLLSEVQLLLRVLLERAVAP